VRFYTPFLLAIVTTLSLNACRTVSPSSQVKYSTESTSLEAVKAKLCKDFKKVDDCILHLRGYKADESVQAALLANQPVAMKKLKEYGLPYDKRTDSQVAQKFGIAERSGLSDGEFFALALYTADDYVPMNAALRGDAAKWKEYSSQIYGTASALSKLKSYANTDTVYRTELADAAKLPIFLKTYEVGNYVLETPFLSTSTDSELDFVSPKVGKVQLKYSIVSKTGVDVKNLSSETSEGEVLFAPGTVFRVTSVLAKKVDIADEDEDDAKPIMVDVLEIGMSEIDPL
jgi:hypothetical protein